jgi:hypothetical protein
MARNRSRICVAFFAVTPCSECSRPLILGVDHAVAPGPRLAQLQLPIANFGSRKPGSTLKCQFAATCSLGVVRARLPSISCGATFVPSFLLSPSVFFVSPTHRLPFIGKHAEQDPLHFRDLISRRAVSKSQMSTASFSEN